MLLTKTNSDGIIDTEVAGIGKEVITEFVSLCTTLSKTLSPMEVVKIATIGAEYYEHCKQLGGGRWRI